MRKKKHGNRASSYIRREGAADVIDMEPVHSLTSVHRTSHHRSSHHRMGPFKELLQVNNYKEGQGAYWCHFCKIIMAGLSISMTSASKAEFNFITSSLLGKERGSKLCQSTVVQLGSESGTAEVASSLR